ncbi:MAG: ABC transporter substrate-binding protein [Lachnospiraceae bacterium]|nr:ABC transporter substrate-binding protein [Lachnospiraceae bacterium]
MYNGIFYMKILIGRMMLGVAVACLLAGCASGGRPSGSARQSHDRDGVVVAISSEPATLDPVKGWGHGNTPLIQSTLIKYDSDMGFEKDLAVSYQLDESGLVWTFTLRGDARFTDGETVTASDVAFTFETAKAAQASIDLTFLESAEAVNDTTVIFTLSRPTSVFLNTIASVGIVPQHAYGADYGIDPVGSGPWKFVQWNPQEQLILEANEDYYGEVPSIKNVTIVFMAEDAALAAVESGQVDVALTAATLADKEIEGYHVARVASIDNRGFTLPMQPAEGAVTESGYPIGNDVTCDPAVRQAIAYAIDRELVAEAALNGFATPCYSENDGMPWNNPECVIGTDIDYARKLLADAGWADADGDGIVEKDGVKASFTVLYPSGDSVRQAVAFAAAEQVAEIGIRITVEGTSWDDLSKRMFSEGVMMGWGAANPYESYCLYQSGGACRDDFYNPEGYRSERTDGYLAAAMESLTTEEAYRNWQLVQWDGETGTAMKGACPWVWIVNVDHLYYVCDGLDIGAQQLHPHGSSMPLLQNLCEWKWEDVQDQDLR